MKTIKFEIMMEVEDDFAENGAKDGNIMLKNCLIFNHMLRLKTYMGVR